MVDAAHAVVGVNLAQAIDGTRVHALRLVGGILNLQTGLDVFDWCGDEAHGRAGEDACDAVAQRREVRR